MRRKGRHNLAVMRLNNHAHSRDTQAAVMEFMSAEAICNWLKAHFSRLGKLIDEETSEAIIGK